MAVTVNQTVMVVTVKSDCDGSDSEIRLFSV